MTDAFETLGWIIIAAIGLVLGFSLVAGALL